jgi:hypothetical protein
MKVNATARRVIVAGIVLLILCVIFVPAKQYVLYVGGFYVSVRVKSHAGQIEAVACQVYGEKEQADDAVERLHRLVSLETQVDPFVGEPIRVSIKSMGKDSSTGEQIDRFYTKYLVVIARYRDGQRFGNLVEVPDSPNLPPNGEISVELP